MEDIELKEVAKPAVPVTEPEAKVFVRSTARDTDLKIHPDVTTVKLHGMHHACCFLNSYYNNDYKDEDYNFIVPDGRVGDVVRHRSTVKVWYVWYNCCHEEVTEVQNTFHSPVTGEEITDLPKDILFDITKYVSLRAGKCNKRHDLPLVRTWSNRLVWA